MVRVGVWEARVDDRTQQLAVGSVGGESVLLAAQVAKELDLSVKRAREARIRANNGLRIREFMEGSNLGNDTVTL